MRVLGAIGRAWWRMQLPLEVGFLGFGRDMPWSTSVVLALSSEAWICADLKLVNWHILHCGFFKGILQGISK